MFSLGKAENALVTVYGDTPDKRLESLISSCIPDRELRILTPKSRENLVQGAQNSVLTFVCISGSQDPNLELGAALKDNRLVVSDIVAFCPDSNFFDPLVILSKGFDLVITPAMTAQPEFKKILIQKILIGHRRLSGLILEEEYRRVCDALANAPASMIIFDTDKRAVFISDHYFRAYPRIAARLVRGLTAYDAFEMMAEEEGLTAHDPLYEKLQDYWYNLKGSIEFTIRDITFRLKTFDLPNRRGTLLMAQNITGYEKKINLLGKQAEKLQNEIKI